MYIKTLELAVITVSVILFYTCYALNHTGSSIFLIMMFCDY